METYKIIRGYRDRDKREVIKTGLTLAEAQKHCRNPETSSKTCTSEAGLRRTANYGPWFDGYESE
jgi:hypothetical protein